MSRMVSCSLCDAKKVDGNGHRCVECNGEGWFSYGEDRPLGAIIRDIEVIVEVLDQDRRELEKAKEALRSCKKEHRAQRQKQVVMCGESVDYWESRMVFLDREYREAQERGDDANGGHGTEGDREYESFSLRA